MKRIFIYITLICLALVSCKKDETKVVMLTDPIRPAITSMPDLTLQRAHGTDTLIFVGTPVDPGFNASADYFLEACAKDNGFADPITLIHGVKDNEMMITVSNLNGLLLKKFPADQVSSIDFRIRSVLVVDAGTGAPGTSADPFEYSSDVVSADVTIYGLPRLDLIGSGVEQKIESALGDGVYKGFVKLNTANPFTLKDPDANITYGATGNNLVVNGNGITPPATPGSGWYILTANTKDLNFSTEAYMIGLVGSATPNGWDSPDQKMDYDAKTGTWNITITLVDGDIKFRLNDGWAWNLGGTTDKLEHNGANIPVTAGNYTISLTITNATQGSEAGTFTIVKN